MFKLRCNQTSILDPNSSGILGNFEIFQNSSKTSSHFLRTQQNAARFVLNFQNSSIRLEGSIFWPFKTFLYFLRVPWNAVRLWYVLCTCLGLENTSSFWNIFNLNSVKSECFYYIPRVPRIWKFQVWCVELTSESDRCRIIVTTRVRLSWSGEYDRVISNLSKLFLGGKRHNDEEKIENGINQSAADLVKAEEFPCHTHIELTIPTNIGKKIAPLISREENRFRAAASRYDIWN